MVIYLRYILPNKRLVIVAIDITGSKVNKHLSLATWKVNDKLKLYCDLITLITTVLYFAIVIYDKWNLCIWTWLHGHVPRYDSARRYWF